LTSLREIGQKMVRCGSEPARASASPYLTIGIVCFCRSVCSWSWQRARARRRPNGRRLQQLMTRRRTPLVHLRAARPGHTRRLSSTLVCGCLSVFASSLLPLSPTVGPQSPLAGL
jgi:hypothetical protein